ncbi:MAG: hypothetical protein JSR44_08205 [Spirochaetes bacterium]|nr:hypothetical protein [Spirochaetota bacterium]
MEIAGQRLYLPQNFNFLARLPARFEILVLARGATSGKTTAFELQIAGQSIVLKSETPLKIGARYELEKISATEFRILDEKKEESTAAKIDNRDTLQSDTRIESERSELFINPQTPPQMHDALALRIMKDKKHALEKHADKYVFDFDCEFALGGVFVPHGPGKYLLFISGARANSALQEELQTQLTELGVSRISLVSAQVLEQIATGAVDLRI